MSTATPQAYLFNAPSGVAGDVTRVDETNVQPCRLGNSNATAFGIPLKVSGANVVPFAGSETAADFAGVLIREVPSISGNALQGYSDNTPNSSQIQGMAVRGYVSVLCKVGTPVQGGIVYIRVVADTGKAIGDFEATSDGGNNVALSNTQASWATSGKDANNNAELRIAR